MFDPKHNPNYQKLSNDAKEMIVTWTKNDWYESSTRNEVVPAGIEYRES
jgi:hypothetical protein